MSERSAGSRSCSVLVGGVGELFQGDLDVGRLAAERLQDEAVARLVFVEELHYGAVAVVQRLQELGVDSMILVGAVRRGRSPGTVHRRLVRPPVLRDDELQAAVGDAVTGYVGINLIVEVATGLGALPQRTVVFEIEPEHVGPGEGLTRSAMAGLDTAVDLVRAEIQRNPLLGLAADLRGLTLGTDRLEPSRGLSIMSELLGELELLEREARWGRTFSQRDHLRLAISAGQLSDGMDHQDWGLWWALIEELDRLEAIESVRHPASGADPVDRAPSPN